MAAYWLLTFDMAPESNDHKPPTCFSVSTKPWSVSRRGGVEGGDGEGRPHRPHPGAGTGGNGGGRQGGDHEGIVAVLPRSTKAGATIRLTTRLMAYTSSPRARAFSSSTPRGTRNRTKAPS